MKQANADADHILQSELNDVYPKT